MRRSTYESLPTVGLKQAIWNADQWLLGHTRMGMMDFEVEAIVKEPYESVEILVASIEGRGGLPSNLSDAILKAREVFGGHAKSSA